MDAGGSEAHGEEGEEGGRGEDRAERLRREQGTLGWEEAARGQGQPWGEGKG